MIWVPTAQHMIRLHGKLIRESGGSDGVRDYGLIESAIMRVSAGFDGCERYPTAVEKAAVICCGLVGNHGFVDGNKRIGVAAMLLVLHKNEVPVKFTQLEIIDLGLKIAQGLLDVDACIEWIHAHSVSV